MHNKNSAVGIDGVYFFLEQKNTFWKVQWLPTCGHSYLGETGPEESFREIESAESEKLQFWSPQNEEQHFLTHDMGGVCARRAVRAQAPVDSLEEVPFFWGGWSNHNELEAS